jgi:hypothetical protein
LSFAYVDIYLLNQIRRIMLTVKCPQVDFEYDTWNDQV